MVAFTEDLSVFFALKADGGLADPATASWGGTVNVIFDNAYLEQLGVAGTNPVALAKASDVSAARVGSTLVISGTTYTIRDRQPLDDGETVLLQFEAA